MICAYFEETKNDWDLHLGLLKFAYNSTKNATMEVVPFEQLYGFIPKRPLALQVGKKTTSLLADDFASRQLAIAKKATEAVHKAQKSQKEQFDKHRCDKEFEEGDKVMLSTKAFKAYSKQDPTFIGPYSIRKKFNPLVYKLDLPKDTCFHQ